MQLSGNALACLRPSVHPQHEKGVRRVGGGGTYSGSLHQELIFCLFAVGDVQIPGEVFFRLQAARLCCWV